MIYTFKSLAASDVVMQVFSVEQILGIIGEKKEKLGVIAVSEIPAAIANIESEIERQEGMLLELMTPDGEDIKKYNPVRLRERADPFINFLRSSHEANVDVAWGM